MPSLPLDIHLWPPAPALRYFHPALPTDTARQCQYQHRYGPANRFYRWSLLIGLIIVVVASLAAWMFSPKGDNQTCVSPPSFTFLFSFPSGTWNCCMVAELTIALQALAQHGYSLVGVLLYHVGYVSPLSCHGSERRRGISG